MRNDFYRQTIHQAPFGYAHHEIILDEAGKPFDYRFIEVNEAFEKLTGLKKENLIGRTVRQAIPGIEKGDFDWIGYYGKIALEKGNESLEQYSNPLKKWYKVHAYSTKESYFTTIFIDTATDHIITESSRVFNSYSAENIDYGIILKQMLDITGAKYAALNIFDENQDFTTTAIAGIGRSIQKAISILGYEIEGRKWKYDPEREEKICVSKTTIFSSLKQLCGNSIPHGIVSILEKTFNLGKTVVIKSLKETEPVGDFTLIFEKDTELRNREPAEVYADLTGMLISRIRAEESVAEKKQQYESLVSNIPGITYRCKNDNVRTMLFLSDHVSAVSGYSAVQLLHDGETSYSQLIHEKDREAVSKAISSGVKNKKAWEVEYRIWGKDDNIRWVSEKGCGIYNQQGEVLYLDGFIMVITERRQAEEALKKSETEYRNLFENANDAILIFEPETEIILDANNKSFEIYGFEKEEFIGMSLKNLSIDIKAGEGKIEHTLKSGQFNNFETRQTNKRGEVIYLLVNASVIDYRGRKAILSINRDITERKQAEEALRQNEEKLRSIFRVAPAGIGLVSNRVLIDVNSKVSEMTGYSSDELIGKSARILYPTQKEYEIVGEEKYQQIEKYGTGSVETRWLRKDGKIIDVLLSSTPVDSDNLSKGVTFTALDITERKRAEEKLRHLNHMYKLLLHSAGEGIYVIDINGKHTIVNRMAAQILGYEAEEVVGRNSHSIWHHSKADGMPYPQEECKINATLQDGVAKQVSDEVFWHKDGTPISVEYTVTPIMENGEITGAVVIFKDITNRKQAEMQLRKLSQAVEQSPASVVITNPDGKMEYVNPKFTEITGYTLEEAIGQNPGILKSGEQSEAFYKELWHTISSGKEWKGEFHNKKKNGELYWESALITSITNEKGEILHYLGVKEDITERKTLEIELREKNEFIQTVLDNLPIGVALNKFNEGEAIYMNKKFEEIYGWGKDVLKNIEKFFKHVYPDEKYRNELIERIMADIKSGDPARMRWENIIATRSDGSKRIVNAVNIPLIEQNTMVSTVMDVTEQKKAEAEVVRLNNALFHLIETINELSKATGFTQVQRIVAVAAERITGADGAAFVYRDGDYCHYADEQAIEPLWKGLRFPLEQCITGWVMLNKEPAIIEDVYKDRRIPHEIYKKTFVKSLAAFPVDVSKPEAAIAIYWRTPTKPDSIEIQLMQTLADAAAIALENVNMYLELDNKVMERTAQLEAANKELEAFSYSVSHDLRAPLRAIDGFSKILLEDNAEHLDDDGRRVCNVIRTNTRKMGQLIDDLLAFSRLNRYEMQAEKIDMKTLANSVYHELTTPDSRKHIRFMVEDLHAAYGDPTMIRQVWINLISNAIKFSAQKEPAKIKISSSLKNNMLTYQISDNGVGFDMKYVDKIFGVFQRLHSAKDFEGTGVGLAIVQRVVHRHGGLVEAEGKPEGSATFTFSLPVNNK